MKILLSALLIGLGWICYGMAVDLHWLQNMPNTDFILTSGLRLSTVLWFAYTILEYLAHGFTR